MNNVSITINVQHLSNLEAALREIDRLSPNFPNGTIYINVECEQ